MELEVIKMQIARHHHRRASEPLGELVESTYTPLDGFQAAVAVPSFCFISEKDLIGGFYTEV